MKKHLILGAILSALAFASPAAYADACDLALEIAEKAAANDPNCGVKVKDISRALKEQSEVCKGFHQKIKVCKQSKQDAKKDCDDGTKKEKMECKRALEKEKKDCRDEAKDTQEFDSCKDARRYTSQQSGAHAKCVSKNYGPAIAVCFGQAVLGGR
ncbi:MAG: hypothetical protein JNJ55_13230 [Betaproteobacteria bacterium]|nr:hypothetical protein [Betaproteobacteria bacterium]